MRNKKLSVLAVIICCAFAMSMICAANATPPPATTGSVHIKDNAAGTGPDIIYCNTGTQLWIFWTQSPSGTVVGMKVYDPNNNVILTGSNLLQSASGSLSFTASTTGTYLIVMSGKYDVIFQSNVIASQTVFALPEAALGALAATMAGLAAFGIFSVAKAKHFKLAF